MDTCRTRRGFTLVELLIVVVILAIIAAMAIPSFQSMTLETRQSAFAAELVIMVEAAERYYIKTEEYLPDTSSGVWPVEWAGYIDEQQFEAPTPFGGSWDTELDNFGVAVSIGVHFMGDIPPDSDMAGVDALLDDGVLTTGTFQKLAADRFYYIQSP